MPQDPPSFAVDDYGQLESGSLGGIEWLLDHDMGVGYIRLPLNASIWDEATVSNTLRTYGWCRVSVDEFLESTIANTVYIRLERIATYDGV